MVVSVEKKLRTVYRESPVSRRIFNRRGTEEEHREHREEDWWR